MPIVPMNQTVKVTKAPSPDGWGEPVESGTVKYKARVVEETKVVTNQAGEEAVTTLRIIIDKLPNISYDDALEYTNELGVTIKRRPVRIEIKRGISGRPLLTEVYV